MSWRILHITDGELLRLHRSALCIRRKNPENSAREEELSFPIEDIACVVLDQSKISITLPLLSELAVNNIALIVPDFTHHPAGLLTSFHQHHKQPEIAWLQLELGAPFKKRLWQKIVVRKLENQAAILKHYDAQTHAKLSSFARRVKSGDPDNLEAQGARAYWQALFNDFRRAEKSDRRNALLNYGYAIVRAALARSCVAYGLLPVLGLHHVSKTNPFNLVDDLIEPWRPCVDFHVMERLRAMDGKDGSLSKEDRQYLAAVLQSPIDMGHETQTLLAGLDAMIMSLIRALREKEPAVLLLPIPHLPFRLEATTEKRTRT